jgi:hypothetical protein
MMQLIKKNLNFSKHVKKWLEKFLKEVVLFITGSILSYTHIFDKRKNLLLEQQQVRKDQTSLYVLSQEVKELPIVDTVGSPTYNLASFLSIYLAPLVGKLDSFIKNSNHFVHFSKDQRLEDGDLLVSFDVVSLFTKVPILAFVEIIRHKTNEEVYSLVEFFLRSTFFSFQGVIYEQVNEVAMGSPLSPVIANLYMEHFEEMALHSFPLKPKWWKRYVDDTNVCWPHGLEKLEYFHAHLNSLVPCISFTKEF